MTISDLPGDLGGSHPLRNWLNRLKRAILRRTLLAGLGYKVRQTESGVILEILPGTGGGSLLNPFRISEVSRTETSITVRVANGKITTTGAPFEPDNIATTFPLSLSADHYVYLSITATTATILTTLGGITWSVNKIPLGIVGADGVITQLVRDHIFVPCA